MSPDVKTRRFRRLRRAAAALCLLGLLTYYVLPWLLPWPEALAAPPREALSILSRDGEPLRTLLTHGRRADAPLAIEEIPPAFIHATLAAEDQRFYQHGGVDIRAICRAARDSVLAGRSVSGASTISQQLIKIAQPRPRTFLTKITEFLTARRMEMTWSKDRILTEYLNRLDYGNLTAGCGSAALTYFAKPLRDCSPAECALLAALPQAPTRLNPWRYLARARFRQQWVLGRMQTLGYLDNDAHARAIAEPLHFEKQAACFRAPHAVDHLLTPTQPLTAHLQTTLSLPLQSLCEAATRQRLARLKESHVQHAAVVVIENATGDILAMVGSPDYREAQVNGATSRRSPGSALKPFTYLLALQQGWGPASIIPDLPIEYMTETGLYRPRNYDDRTMGPVSLREALACSLNLTAVRLLQECGGPRALQRALQQTGINTLTQPPAHYGLGLTIGSGEVTLLELTTAYATLARLGIYKPARLLATDPTPAGQRLFDPDACWLLADILSDQSARTRAFGTRGPLHTHFQCAIKTGTSTDYRDNWTLGYTSRHTVGVWVGNFDNTPMRQVSGVTGAGPIFRDIMTWLAARDPSPWYEPPSGWQRVSIDPFTGLPVPPALRAQRPSREDWFPHDYLPQPDPTRYDPTGRLLLPHVYGPWLQSRDNWLGTAVALSPSPPTPQDFHITSPLPGTVFYLDPDLPGGGHGATLVLRATGSDSVTWHSPTLQIDGRRAQLTPGTHTLTATSSSPETTRTTRITVRQR